jgi:uncharacterized membrane protein
MSFFLLVRFLHIVSAMWFIGGILARQIVRAYAKRTDDVQRFATLTEAAKRIESTMVIPGNFAVIIFGIILALITGAPILGFLQGTPRNWLLASNILLIIGFFNVPLIFLPHRKKLDLVLNDALAKGQMTPELRLHINDNTVRIAHWFELVAMAVVVFLMVFKPF